MPAVLEEDTGPHDSLLFAQGPMQQGRGTDSLVWELRACPLQLVVTGCPETAPLASVHQPRSAVCGAVVLVAGPL